VSKVWYDDGYRFNPDADIRLDIINAVSAREPSKALRRAWPWVPAEPRDTFLTEMRTARGNDATVLVERFQHTVRAYWNDPPPVFPLWRRILRWPR
jgi:hypothetical protein